MRRVCCVALLAWLTSATLLPALLRAETEARSQSPAEIIQITTEQMITRLRELRESLQRDSSQLYALFQELVLPRFDFELMSQWVLGKHWQEASGEQQARFVTAFRNLLVRTYAIALLEYTDQEIDYPAVEMAEGARRVTVPTRILPAQGQPIPLNYSMHHGSEGWRVFDITVDGVSIISNYRSNFDRDLRRDGLDRLIERLDSMAVQTGRE
jgi:phospholipid transport system substrate-binding protein